MTVNRTKRASDPTKEILKGITTYLDGGEQPVAEEPTAKAKAPMNIGSKTLSAAKRKIQRKTDQQQRVSVFTPFQPAPGVLPKGQKLAMDEMYENVEGGFDALNSWAWGGGTQFAEGTTFLGYPYLAELTQRPEYRKIVERVATEMTRKWIKLEVTSDVDGELDDAEKKARAEAKGAKIKDIWKRMTELKVRDAFRVAAEHDGGFGRGHIFLDVGRKDEKVDSTELVTPISFNGRVSKQKVNSRFELRAVRNVEPMWAYPQQYNSTNPLAPDWYKPSIWYVMATPVHCSRFLTMVGREVPDILKPAYAFGGLAMTQMAKPYVDNWLRTRQAVCDLIESFSVSGVYTNMASTLQAGAGEGGDGGIIDRMELFNLIRTNSGSMVLDKDTEEFFNISTPLGTLDALQAQAQEQMASVSSIPVAILLGLQPKGLNASSEAEVRIFYDFIGAAQENIFRDPLKVVIDAIQLSLFNEVDPEITFSFEPLWSLSDKERAEVKKIEAETGQILIDGGVLDPLEERRRIADDPEMGYTSIDVEDVPEPPEDPMMGGEGDDEGDDGENTPPANGKAPKNPPAGKDAPAKDGVVPFLVSGAPDRVALDEAKWDESKHPRAPDGKFGSGGGSSSSGEAKAGEATKKAVSAFGGLWKETGKGDKADFQATAAYYLGKAPKSGTHYRNMLKKLIDGADANGLGEVQKTALKTHLFHALAAVKNKLSDDFNAAAAAGDDKAKKQLEKLFDNATKQQKDLKLDPEHVSATAPAIKENEKNDKAEKSVTAKVAEQALKENPGMAATVAASKNDAAATHIKSIFDKFNENTKGFSAEAMKNPETIAKEKIKAVAQMGGTAATANNLLTPAEKAAIAKSHHKTVEKNFEVSENYVKQANAASESQKIAEAKAKQEAADFEQSLNSPEAKEHYEALNGILSGNATALINTAAKKLKTLGKAYDKMTPGGAAQVMAYSGSYYREVNKQLRAGLMTEEQYKFAASLNQALETMPKYEGVTRRGATLSPEQVAMYKPGMIIEERGFTSTSTASGFGGNTRFEVKGKTGRDISKLSHYPSEAEVLFKAGTRFKVVSNKDNKIVLEEVNFGRL